MRIPFAVPAPDGTRVRRRRAGAEQRRLRGGRRAALRPRTRSSGSNSSPGLPGGQVATAIVACARLGWRTRYIGSFGDDEPGRLSRESLTREGVDISAARTVPGADEPARGDSRRFAIGRAHGALAPRSGAARGASRRRRVGCASGRLLLVDCDDIPAATVGGHRPPARSGIPTIIDVDDVQPGTRHAAARRSTRSSPPRNFPSALTGHADLGRALEAHRARVSRAARLRDAWRGGQPGAMRRPRNSHPGLRRRMRRQHGGRRRVSGRLRVGMPALAGRRHRDAFSRMRMRPAALSCRALGARGGLPDAEEIDAYR